MPFRRKVKPEVREFLEKYGAKFPGLRYEDLAKTPLEFIKFIASLCSLTDVENFAMADKSTAVFTLRNMKFRYLAFGWYKRCTLKVFMPIKIPTEVSLHEFVKVKEGIFDDRVEKDIELSEYLKNCRVQSCEYYVGILKGDKYLPPGEWIIIRWSDLDPSTGALSGLNEVERFLKYLTRCVEYAREDFESALNKISPDSMRLRVHKCEKCGFGIPLEAAFCPKCGTPVAKKMSDEKISKLIFRRWGRRYDDALEAAYTAFVYDLEKGALHRDLLVRYMAPDMMPREAWYQDEAVKRFMRKHEGDLDLRRALSQYKLGLIYENGRRLKDAVKEYNKVLEKYPDFAPALARRGSVWSAMRKLKNALNDFLKAGEVDPEFCLAFFQQGILYKARGKRDKALESYKKCVALDPDNAAAHNNMGLIYVDKRDFESAEREFKEVLRILPNHPTGLRNLELAKRRIGRGWRKFF